MTRVALLALLATTVSLAACAAEPAEEDTAGELGEDALTAKADEHWFYTGSLPRLENATVIVSLRGNTARVSGLAPAGATIPTDLPHVKTKIEKGRTRVDAVYPIATANASIGKTNSRPGSYAFYMVKPYRPDGAAFTQSEGEHFVPWGGFPFIAYNEGIALHGPITSKDNVGSPDANVWYLRRGAVSGGCNRMLGEHVVEVAHLLGVNMRKVYDANRAYGPREVNLGGKVNVIADYDKYDDKWIDVDYATDTGVTRPGKVYGDANVVMFGSWIGTETPDGRDLPPSMQWEAGISGKPYVFAKHARANTVCSLPKSLLRAAKELAGSGELPMNLCANKACYVDALKSGASVARERCAR